MQKDTTQQIKTPASWRRCCSSSGFSLSFFHTKISLDYYN